MIKLIVGLGNVGAQFAHTRHNAGFWFVDMLAQHYNISWRSDKRFFGEIGEGHIADHSVRLLKPHTLMNLSGKAVVPLVKFYNIAPSQILVCHDELDIGAGFVKLKTGGGHGGHNGLRDIIPHIGADFHRLRIGIDRPSEKGQVSAFVLSKPSGAERTLIDDALMVALQNTPFIFSTLERARENINRHNPSKN